MYDAQVLKVIKMMTEDVQRQKIRFRDYLYQRLKV